MLNFDTAHIAAQERHRDFLVASANNRRAALAAARLPFARRVARPLGRQLMRLSLALLRYGQDEVQPTTALYRHPTIGSAELN